MLRSRYPVPLSEGGGEDRSEDKGMPMDDMSLKDRIAAVEERLNTFGRYL